ncbi:MAG: VanZ family protein [Candidatus Pristimantibacillus lignocellulolyticus]|uniref:VanZ family protein n=1 Tax=Candidatus Pristimantibacillus lignocellulolyticus TaxID=2994561 RepID=A0A9J6ZCH7_9BACL|nr:MAG: VanZ family protein [Candidatus Pristimantibacillus lignocellulolyticus]
MKAKYPLILLIMYLLLLVYWMLFGFGRSPQLHYQYNLIPLTTIIEMFQLYPLFSKPLLINIIGNIIVFVPFGILLPILINKKLIFLLAIFLIGLTIMELSQLLLRRGSLDVDDYLLNSIGFLIGYVLFISNRTRITNSIN